jgi:hypothetical protein
MKWAARLGGILAVMVLTALTASPGLAQQPEFCWKDSYARGVGTIPSYSLCPSGMVDGKDSRVPPSLSDTDAHELRVPTAGVDNAAMIRGDGNSDANPP